MAGGGLWLAKQSLISALVWLKRQFAYEPEGVWPYNNLGWAYLGADSLEQARQIFTRALQIDSRCTVDL